MRRKLRLMTGERVKASYRRLWHYTSRDALPLIAKAGYLDVTTNPTMRKLRLPMAVHCYHDSATSAVWHDADKTLVRFTISVPEGDVMRLQMPKQPLPPQFGDKAGRMLGYLELFARCSLVKRRVPASEWVAVAWRASALTDEWHDMPLPLSTE